MSEVIAKLVDVELEYPASVVGYAPKARGKGKARLTASQIVVVSAEVTEQLRDNGRILMGGLPYRYQRNNWLPIPRGRGGWRLTKVHEQGNQA